jgi:protein SCO1/2
MIRAVSLFCVTAVAIVATLGSVAHAENGVAMDDADAHAHMHHAVAEERRVVAHYAVPAVQLVREDGTAVRLDQEMDDGRPVVLAFIYTSCTTVCPLVSNTLADVQRRLGDQSSRVHLMSISIDPDQDTPARLREYAKTFHAGPAWQHYTGTIAASQTAQRAFDVYRGNKMDHAPSMLVRAAPGAAWVRIDGFATADQLIAELPALHASR